MILEINRPKLDGDCDVLELVADDLSIKLLPGCGNLIYSMTKQQTEYLWFPSRDLDGFLRSPRLAGIPLLAPWANRLDEAGFDFQGIHYSLNSSIDYSKDSNGLPIHGFLAFSPHWQKQAEIITDEYVEVSSRLEFWKYAELMTHFPFAHEYELIYRLQPQKLEVILKITNRGNQEMPVMVGFHPYFQLPRSERSKWHIQIPALKQLVLNDMNLPTGMTTTNTFRQPVPLGKKALDHVFIRLQDEPFVVESDSTTIAVRFTQGYSSAVVYAPTSRDVICFEPMSAPTNSLSRYHRDKSVNLPVIGPDSSWTGTYSIAIQSRGK